ncbi:MAG: hypothetical protein ACYSUX_15520, partial [Planctomycetota bacterium]
MRTLHNHALAADRKKPRPLKSGVKISIPNIRYFVATGCTDHMQNVMLGGGYQIGLKFQNYTSPKPFVVIVTNYVHHPITVDGVVKVAVQGKGDVIREMAVLSGSPQAARCVAATAVTALKIVR